ncbi:MAG: ribokinase [Candidatus Eisenbacteria bacterium]|nr:ribokinase [Candidatus Eisenbacteria bacterium]
MIFGLEMPEERAFDAVGLGLNAVDHLCVVGAFPEPDTKPRVDRFARSPGGQAASAMVVLSRLGYHTKYIGKVGGDEIGRFSLESIRSEGVDVADVVTVGGVTNQLAMIIVDTGRGERTILWHRPDDVATLPDEVAADAVSAGRVLLVDGHDAEAAARAAELARERGTLVVMDAESVKRGTRELVERVDVLLASRDFPERLTGETNLDRSFDLLRAMGPRVVGVTLGRLGSIVMTADGSVYGSPSFDVEVVDTTGAGDVYHGAFIAGLLEGWSVERTVDFANAAAALNCEGLGARFGPSSRREVEALVERQRRRPGQGRDCGLMCD